MDVLIVLILIVGISVIFAVIVGLPLYYWLIKPIENTIKNKSKNKPATKQENKITCNISLKNDGYEKDDGRFDKEEENDEEFWEEIAEFNSNMKALYGGFSSGKSSKQKRIEEKKKRLAELEKEYHWERNYDPAWDTGSYAGNNWDSEEEKLDKQIGNLEQQNLSYGQWMDFEDRRTYRDESDPTEMPDEDEYGV